MKIFMMNKIFLLICVIFAITVAILIKVPIEQFWASYKDYSEPKYSEKLVKEWVGETDDFLINKLGHPAPSWNSAAKYILSQRSPGVNESHLIKIIQSDRNFEKRRSALSILFVWNESEAIRLSMEILASGRDNPLYSSALLHLSKRKYEPAYQYAIDLAVAFDKYTNGSSAYLSEFGKLESLPILEEMLENSTNSLHRKIIKRAIESIKSQNSYTGPYNDTNSGGVTPRDTSERK